MFSKQSRPAPVTEQWLPARRPEWKLAELSDGLMPLMRENGLAVEFLPGLSTGLWIADASRNPTNAYKVRGALASAQAAQLEGKRFLVTASAGNHGAGIAYAAQLRGMKARVYVPENAPQVKIQKIEGFGAEIKKAGSTFDE
jgi:threonine dehydratase